MHVEEHRSAPQIVLRTHAPVSSGPTVDVDLSRVTRESGSSSVALLSVWKAAFPSEDPTALRFDLVGSDGFRPMSRPHCTHLLSAEEITRGHLDPVTHNVSYDPDLKLPGCYRVRAVVKIAATR